MVAQRKLKPCSKSRKKAKIIKIGKIKRKKITLATILGKCFSVPFLVVFTVICATLCINLRVQINDIKTEISKANKECKILESKNTALKCKLENMLSYNEVVEYAEKHGLVKKSEAQVHYINTGREDYAEIVK